MVGQNGGSGKQNKGAKARDQAEDMRLYRDVTTDELKQVPVNAVRAAQPVCRSLKSARKRQREPGEYLMFEKWPFQAPTAVLVDENEDSQPPKPKSAPSSASPMHVVLTP